MPRAHAKLRPRWSQKELNLLKKHYKKSWNFLIKKINRTRVAILDKMYELNLYRGYEHLKGSNNPRFGTIHTEATKSKMKTASVKRVINHHKYGKTKNIIIKQLKVKTHSIIHSNLYEFVGQTYPKVIDKYFKWLKQKGKISNAIYKKIAKI